MRRISIIFGLLLVVVPSAQGFLPIHPDALLYPIRTVACVLVGIALAYSSAGRALVRRVHRWFWGLSDRAFNFLVFGAGVCLYSWSSWFVLHGSPRLDDEVAAVFQARIFASGHVVLPLPPLSQFFHVFGVLGFVARRGHWCGMYPPGWPALLTPGVWLGVVWLVTPLMGAAMAVATSQLGRELFGRRVGRIAGLLALGSPLITVLAGTRLSSIATALFGCWCAVAVLRLLKTGRWWWGALAGCSFGVAFLCRPLTALVIGVSIALFILARWRTGILAWRGIVAALLLAVAAVGVLAAFQHTTTGRWNLPGHAVGMGARGKIGFGRLDRARTHTVELGLDYSFRRLRALNDRLQGWPVGAFVLMALPWLLGRSTHKDLWLLLPAGGLVLSFFPYWYYDIYFQGQYVSESTPMLFILMARGWRELVRWMHKFGTKAKAFPAGFATGCYLFVAMVSNPSYFAQFHPNYGDVESVLPRVVEHYSITNAVVFMDQIGEGTDLHDPRNNFYATGFMRNDLTLTGDVIYARNLKEKNPQLINLYSNRSYYLYRFNRATTRARLYEMHLAPDVGYTLVPVPPDENRWLEEAPPPPP